MKSLYYEKHYDQEQFQICIKNLPSDQRADSGKTLENIGTKLLKIFTIGVCPRYRESGSAISETLRIMSKIYDAAFLFL